MSSGIEPNLKTDRLFWSVVAFRSIGAIGIVIIINSFLPLGTPLLITSIAGLLGVVGASLLARSRLTNLGCIALLTTLPLFPTMFFWGLTLLLSPLGLASLFIEKLTVHTNTGCLIAAATGLATWIFWRARIAVTIEALLFFAAAIAIFSGHREFHLDRPKILNSLAWRLGIDPLSMLFVLGAVLLLSVLLYLYLASLATRPRVDKVTIKRAYGGRQIITTLAVMTLMIGALYLVQHALYKHFNAIMLGRVANGVGMGSSQGMSPLSFQSALGSSNQPAALVRLEGDYSNNPFSPMMYLRETALSSFSGKEMVFAGRAFDTDLPVIAPREAFTRKEDAELGHRTPLIQSIYLLAEHTNAFAVDYPVSIVQLKNPKPTRFSGTYRAYSVAPAYALSEIEGSSVGDPRWAAEVREHYLVQHSDPRYKELAEKIAGDIKNPIEKAQALTSYLSKTAIYTLAPRHEVKPAEDPVAPFMFGDHRGYCVHFAHAITYMARALGIPARVATGYLTDLSQAKDGHILLRMSDRHAWGEIYITEIGWVPFDVQPEQVESHAETQVDAKLLEELMGILQPGEEILPKDSVKDEAGMLDPDQIWTPDPQLFINLLYLSAALFLLLKLTLRQGWRLARSPATRLRWGYISVASSLCDIGITRERGETRVDFAKRVTQVDLRPLTQLVVTKGYSSNYQLQLEAVTRTIKATQSPLKTLPRWKRPIVAVNPASIVKLLGGASW